MVGARAGVAGVVCFRLPPSLKIPSSLGHYLRLFSYFGRDVTLFSDAGPVTDSSRAQQPTDGSVWTLCFSSTVDARSALMQMIKRFGVCSRQKRQVKRHDPTSPSGRTHMRAHHHASMHQMARSARTTDQTQSLPQPAILPHRTRTRTASCEPAAIVVASHRISLAAPTGRSKTTLNRQGMPGCQARMRARLVVALSNAINN